MGNKGVSLLMKNTMAQQPQQTNRREQLDKGCGTALLELLHIELLEVDLQLDQVFREIGRVQRLFVVLGVLGILERHLLQQLVHNKLLRGRQREARRRQRVVVSNLLALLLADRRSLVVLRSWLL